MNRIALLAFLVIATLAWNGCSSLTSSNSGTGFLSALSQYNIPASTMNRIENGRVLSFDDVLNLVQSDVPGSSIKAYLQSTRAPYAFSQKQINALVNAGADSTLVNFVSRSQGDFLIDAQNAASQDRLLKNAKIDKSFWDNPYFSDFGYWGDAPFDFGYPLIW